MDNPLATYLRANRIKPGTFARTAGFDRPLVSRWLNGERIPNGVSATRIERATGGAIPVSAWAKFWAKRAA